MTTSQRLIDGYDSIVCDLDGVVYAGPEAIEHAVASLTDVQQDGVRIRYATNNASRPPAAVAGHLRDLGLEVEDGDVLNSSMAGARVLGCSLDEGAPVLAVGGEGVAAALAEQGLRAVRASEAGGAAVVAVLQGYGPDVCARDLAEVAHAVQSGARWVATNTDLTLPTDRGIAPGNGSLVGAVRHAVDVDPEVVGKPMPVMYEMAAELDGLEPSAVLAIGDRLETDIEGAVSAGMESVLVLTGVHDLADAAAAAPCRRPTYVIADLRGLLEPYEVTRADSTQLPGLRHLLADLWAQVDDGALEPDDAAERMRQAVHGGPGHE